MKPSKNNRVEVLEPSVTAHAVLYLRSHGGEGTLGRALQAEGFAVHYLRRPAMLRAACSTLAYQALIADPGTGHALAELPGHIRPRICLVLHGDDASMSARTGLTLAADTPPAEIIAHLRALQRRVRGYPPQYRAGPLGIDVLRGRASLAGQPLRLGPRELRALALLAHRPWQAIPTAQLAATLHPEGGGCPSLVPTYIGRLRRHLGARFIETLPGIGYRLTPPEKVSP
jgi:DNA-binding response OmpR family regulator